MHETTQWLRDINKRNWLENHPTKTESDYDALNDYKTKQFADWDKMRKQSEIQNQVYTIAQGISTFWNLCLVPLLIAWVITWFFDVSIWKTFLAVFVLLPIIRKIK